MKSVITTEHQRPNILSTQNQGRLLSTLILNSIAFVIVVLMFSCSSDTQLRNKKIMQSQIVVVDSTTQNAMDILTDEPTLSHFNSLQKDIHSLATLSAAKTNQLVLMAPADSAFEADNLKKPNEMDLSEKHFLMKNSIIFQPKSTASLSGRTQTYGGRTIELDLEQNQIRSGNSSTRILKQVQLNNGNTMYIVDAVLSTYHI